MEFHSHPSPVIRLLPLYINAADQKRMKSNSQDSFVMKTRISIHRFLVSLVLGIEIIYGLPSVSPSVNDTTSSLCFPSLGFKMPTEVPSDSIISQDKWWCSPTTEHAFLGFSYEITACQSRSQLVKEFKDMRNHFNSRYVRLYGFCDSAGFYDDIVEAAWESGLGVHALVWFGFDGDDLWIRRRETLFADLHSNSKAKFVTRVVQFGSEPLFDGVMSPKDLTAEVVAAKARLSSLRIPITVSEMAFGYQRWGGAPDVLDAVDFINIHMLPFFAQAASVAKASWPLVQADLNWFIAHGNGKKMYFDENGWPSVTSPGVQPNSPNAVANVQNEYDYFALLDAHCSDLKKVAGGGVAWFAHLYSDNQEIGYGIYSSSGRLKFPFAPLMRPLHMLFALWPDVHIQLVTCFSSPLCDISNGKLWRRDAHGRHKIVVPERDLYFEHTIQYENIGINAGQFQYFGWPS